MGGVGGDDGVLQVHVVEEGLDLGGLGGVVGYPDLGDDRLRLVEHGGEQLDLPVEDAAQPLAVDRDRGRRPVQPAGVREVAQPAAEDLVQDSGVDEVQERADPGLARRDDLPPQRVRPPAEVAQHVLGQVSGMVADLPERPGASKGARGGNGKDEDEPVAAAPWPAGVRDQGQHGQQTGDLSGPVLDHAGHAGHGGNSGMRHWSGGLSVPG